MIFLELFSLSNVTFISSNFMFCWPVLQSGTYYVDVALLKSETFWLLLLLEKPYSLLSLMIHLFTTKYLMIIMENCLHHVMKKYIFFLEMTNLQLWVYIWWFWDILQL